MAKQFDLKKEWANIKKQITKFSNDVSKVIKKGEEEILRFSKSSKRHIDSTTLSLKKEHLYYLIGKEYVSIKKPGQKTAKLKKLIVDFKKIETQQRSLKKSRRTS